MLHSQVAEWNPMMKAGFILVRSIPFKFTPSHSLSAMRQTWDEIGIDLAEPSYTYIGQLDDREITTSLGKRLLMILSPFVFLQLTPHAPPPDPIPSITLHWTPLSTFVSPNPPPMWSTVTVDAASRIAPKHSAVLRLLVRVFLGTMQFPAIVLQPSHDQKHFTPNTRLKLWGLSLGMTLDLMSYMINPTSLHDRTPLRDTPPSSPLSDVMQFPYQNPSQDFRMEYVAPSLASVFPRFSYPDVNFWIWSVIFLFFDNLLHSRYNPGSLVSATGKSFVGGKRASVKLVPMINGNYSLPLSAFFLSKWPSVG